MNKKVGVISDIHSNAISLEVTLKDLLNEKIDMCIILGDLLTYGTEPNKVIHLLLEFKTKIKCIFIKGNHDQFYFDMFNNINPIKYKMAEFVKESIFWTNEKLEYNLYESFEWHESFELDNILFSHANPFDYGDWTYLNKEEDILKAAFTLKEKKFEIGIFGHTHRNTNYLISENCKNCNIDLSDKFVFNNNKQLILNPGSLGQPRGSSSSYLILDISNDFVKFNNIIVDIDKKQIINKTINSDLSLETKNKLNTFWEINND